MCPVSVTRFTYCWGCSELLLSAHIPDNVTRRYAGVVLFICTVFVGEFRC